MAVQATDLLLTTVFGNYDAGHFVSIPWWEPYGEGNWPHIANSIKNKWTSTPFQISPPELVEEIIRELNQKVNATAITTLILSYYAPDTRTIYQISIHLNETDWTQLHRYILDDITTKRSEFAAAKALLTLEDQNERLQQQPRLRVLEEFFARYPEDFTLQQVEELMFDEVWAIASADQKLELIELAASVNPEVVEMGCLETSIYKVKRFVSGALQWCVVRWGLALATLRGVAYLAVCYPNIIWMTVVLAIFSYIARQYEMGGYIGWVADKTYAVCSFMLEMFICCTCFRALSINNMLVNTGSAIEADADMERAMKISICGPRVKEIWQDLVSNSR